MGWENWSGSIPSIGIWHGKWSVEWYGGIWMYNIDLSILSTCMVASGWSEFAWTATELQPLVTRKSWDSVFFSAFAPRPAASLAEPTQNCQKSLLTKGGVPPASWFIRLYKTHLTSVKVGYIYYKPADSVNHSWPAKLYQLRLGGTTTLQELWKCRSTISVANAPWQPDQGGDVLGSCVGAQWQVSPHLVQWVLWVSFPPRIVCVCVLWFQKIDILLRFCAVVFPEVLVFYDVPEKATLDAGIMRGFRVIQNRCCHGSPLQQASQYTEGRWRQ